MTMFTIICLGVILGAMIVVGYVAMMMADARNCRIRNDDDWGDPD